MPIKTYRPTTPTRRFQTTVSREEITRDQPEKALVKGKTRSGGRNSKGRICIRFRGGGHKQRYRIVDFKRDKGGIPGGRGRDRLRSEPLGEFGAFELRGWRKALHFAADRLEGRHEGDVGTGGGHSCRQFSASSEYPAGNDCPQRRAAAGQGRPDGARARARRFGWFQKRPGMRC